MISEKIVGELSRQRKEPEWLLQKRLEAFRDFAQMPLPSFRYGLHIMLQPDFDFDGIEIKPDKIMTHGLNKFKDKFATLPEKDKFFYLNLALAKIGLVHARTGERISIELDRKEQFCHTLIIAEPNSQVSIAESVSGDEEYKSNFVEIFAARDAIVNFASIQNTNSKNYISGKYASIKENAKVNWFDATIGAEFAKSSVVSLLDGKNAEECFRRFVPSGQSRIYVLPNPNSKKDSFVNYVWFGYPRSDSDFNCGSRILDIDGNAFGVSK